MNGGLVTNRLLHATVCALRDLMLFWKEKALRSVSAASRNGKVRRGDASFSSAPRRLTLPRDAGGLF